MNCAGSAAVFKTAGVVFVARYYANKGKKVLSRDEAATLCAHGLSIVAIWEDGFPRTPRYFSYAKGVDDGTSAFHDALIMGQPSAAPIYFAVDYDAAPTEIAGCINDYFRGIHAGLEAAANGGVCNPVGVYGSGAACSWLLARELARYTWLSQSTGWRGYHEFASWNIRQGPRDKAFTINVDADEANEDYGGFVVAAG